MDGKILTLGTSTLEHGECVQMESYEGGEAARSNETWTGNPMEVRKSEFRVDSDSRSVFYFQRA